MQTTSNLTGCWKKAKMNVESVSQKKKYVTEYIAVCSTSPSFKRKKEGEKKHI